MLAHASLTGLSFVCLLLLLPVVMSDEPRRQPVIMKGASSTPLFTSDGPRLPTRVELADAARDDPELMASVSAKCNSLAVHQQLLDPPGVCKVPEDVFDGHMRVVQGTPADSDEQRLPTRVELADAARDDPELMASVSAKVGDGVGLLFTENGQQIPQESFDQLAADFAASGQKMIGLPASMITSNASVREARISLEKQTGVYMFDESDPLDLAPNRKYSLANQIHLLRLTAYVRNAPDGVDWVDYIARPDVVKRLDEIAAELGIPAGNDPNLHKPRHMLCFMIHEQREKEKKDPSIEPIESRLARLERIEAQTNRLVYAFVQEKVRRAELERQQPASSSSSKARPDPPSVHPDGSPKTDPNGYDKHTEVAASLVNAPAGVGLSVRRGIEVAVASRRRGFLHRDGNSASSSSTDEYPFVPPMIDPSGGGRPENMDELVSNLKIFSKEQRDEYKRKQKNAKRRQLAREAAFRKAIERGDKKMPNVPEFSLKDLENEMFDFDAVKQLTDELIAQHDKEELKQMIGKLVANPDPESVEKTFRSMVEQQQANKEEKEE
jgi:hypothetical protein